MSKEPDTHCNATTKSRGGHCTKPAGWGTNHAGTGRCKWHGGSSEAGILAAAKQEVVVMGVPVENLHPGEALIFCCKITAGEVEYCNEKIAALMEEDAVGHPEAQEIEYLEIHGAQVGEQVKRKLGTPDLHIWIRTRQHCVDRLAKFCKMALDANVDERRVRLAENHGEDLARLLKGLLSDLKLTEAQRKEAPALVEKHLLLLEAAPGGMG